MPIFKSRRKILKKKNPIDRNDMGWELATILQFSRQKRKTQTGYTFRGTFRERKNMKALHQSVHYKAVLWVIFSHSQLKIGAKIAEKLEIKDDHCANEVYNVRLLV